MLWTATTQDADTILCKPVLSGVVECCEACYTRIPEWDVRVDVQTAIGQNMSDSYTQLPPDGIREIYSLHSFTFPRLSLFACRLPSFSFVYILVYIILFKRTGTLPPK